MSELTNAAVQATLTPTLKRLLPAILPPAARAVTLEITAWLVTIRVFLGGRIDDLAYEELDRELEPILNELGDREGDAWELLLMLVRQDPPEAVRVLGTVVWTRPDTAIDSLNPP